MTSNYNVLHTGTTNIPSKWKLGDVITPEHFSSCVDPSNFFKFIDCKIVSLDYPYGIGAVTVDHSQWSNEDEYPNRLKKVKDYQKNRFGQSSKIIKHFFPI